METDYNGLTNPEELAATSDPNQIQENVQAQDASAFYDQGEARKRKHHDEHSVSRKYRLFSNHSSYGDSPHTNTSF